MKQYMNQSEYAAHRGISQPRVSKLIKVGKLKGAVRYDGNRVQIDWKKANELLRVNLDPSRKTKEEQASREEKVKVASKGDTIGLGYHQSKALLEQYKAAMAKLDYEARSKKYVLRNDVEASGLRIGKMVRMALEGTGNKLAPVLVDLDKPAPIADLINREINQILIKLAEELKRV